MDPIRSDQSGLFRRSAAGAASPSAGTDTPIKVAFVGYGYTHRTFHLPAILLCPEYIVHAFVQRKEFPIDKRTGLPGPSCVDDYPNAIRYSSMEDMLKDADVELVVVVTPGPSHAGLCIQALEAGKNGTSCIGLADSSHCGEAILYELSRSGQCPRSGKEEWQATQRFSKYDSCFRTVNKIVKSGVLGEITSAQIRYDINFPKWATGNTDPGYTPGNGLMFGIGSHSIDQALELFGLPSHITGFYRALRGVESKTDDTYMIVLRYDHTHPDLQVIIGTEVVSVMPHQLRYFVRGRKGSYIKLGEDPQEEQRSDGIELGDERLGVEEEARWGILNTKTKVRENQVRQKELWGGEVWTGKVESEKGSGADYYRDLAKALRGTGPLVVDPKQSRDGIKIMELARESYDTGRTLKFK